MEQRPHVPGYGRGEKIGEYMDREMTLEELDAMEVEPMVVEKKGVVKSKVEALKKPDAVGMQHRIKTEEMSLHLLQEKLARETFSGKTAQVRATEAQIAHKKREIEKIKGTLMHDGKAGRA